LCFCSRRERMLNMNLVHRWMCRSERRKKVLREELVPWVLEDSELGRNVLEIGPGPGLTTQLLQPRIEQLTAIEIDEKLAAALQRRFAGSNVRVVRGDGASMPFEDASFSGAVAFTMLHHVPSPDLQDRLLRQVWRVLKPGSRFVGTDSLVNLYMKVIHIADTLVPIDPSTFPARLESAGFRDVRTEIRGRRFRFSAVRG
jgi:SAM-dependent methyltransferase